MVDLSFGPRRHDTHLRCRDCEIMSAFDPAQRQRIDAIAKAGRRRTIGEHVSEVGVAYIAQYFDALHPIGGVQLVTDHIFPDGFGERRPASAGVKFQGRVEQLRSTAHTGINARLVRLAVFAAERRFRAMLSGDLKLFGGKNLSPFRFGFIYLPVRNGIFFRVVQDIIPVHRNCFWIERFLRNNGAGSSKTNGRSARAMSSAFDQE